VNGAERQEIALLNLGGLQTWGAYQHYGDPFFRFVTETAEKTNPRASTVSASAHSPNADTVELRPATNSRKLTNIAEQKWIRSSPPAIEENKPVGTETMITAQAFPFEAAVRAGHCSRLTISAISGAFCVAHV
jgi:hypothetical protein